MVKWIDQFRLPHLSTKTASVLVLLQKIPIDQQHRLRWLEREDIQSQLGKPYRFKDEVVFRDDLRVHVGALPLINIGDVFLNTQRIGYLPRTKLSVTIPDIEGSQRTVRLEENQNKPLGWGENIPHKILNGFEFIGTLSRFPKSQCVVFEHNDTTIVIPKTVIFTRFFVPHRALANAFTNGPWSLQQENIVHIHETESGLRTGISPEGHWKIVLRDKVPSAYAPLVALLYFDPFARKCAEAIYSEALRARGRQDGPWHCSADIPFRNASSPYRFQFSGYYLTEFRAKQPGATRRKFLVTQISGSSYPSYAPDTILHERGNSNEEAPDAEDIQTVNEPPPYSAKPKTRKPNENTGVDSTVDANPNYTSTELPGDEFSWFGAPHLKKMEKKISKRRVGPSKPIDSTPPTDDVSVGNDGYNQGNIPPGVSYIRVREPDKRFEHILRAFQTLKDNETIQEYRLFSPQSPLQGVYRGANLCWNFLDEESRFSGNWPTRGWSILKKQEPVNDLPQKSIPRSALVVGVKVGPITGYWIEIECRPKEKNGYLSPFLYNLMKDPDEAVDFAIDLIAYQSGRNLREAFKSKFGPFGKHRCYRHAFQSKDDAHLDVNSLTTFFQKLEVPASTADRPPSEPEVALADDTYA